VHLERGDVKKVDMFPFAVLMLGTRTEPFLLGRLGSFGSGVIGKPSLAGGNLQEVIIHIQMGLDAFHVE